LEIDGVHLVERRGMGIEPIERIQTRQDDFFRRPHDSLHHNRVL
jgi:hypothetical protein